MNLNHVKTYNREIGEWLLKVFALAASIPKDELVRRSCSVYDSAENVFFANNGYLDYVQCSLIYLNQATHRHGGEGISGRRQIADGIFLHQQEI